MATKKQLNDATFFLVAVPKGSGETYPPPVFPPSTRVWYRRTTSGDLRGTTDGDGRVTTFSAT